MAPIPTASWARMRWLAHLEAYARSFRAPVRDGVRVAAVAPDPNGAGFLVRIEEGTYAAAEVVVATGALQRPFIPNLSADLPVHIAQVVPYDYRNSAALPPGAVLVVIGQAGSRSPRSWDERGGWSNYRSAAVGGRRVATVAWISRSGSVRWAGSTGPSTASRPGPGPACRTRSSRAAAAGATSTCTRWRRKGWCCWVAYRVSRTGQSPSLRTWPRTWRWAMSRRWVRLRAIDDHIREQGLDAPPADPPDYLRPAAELARGRQRNWIWTRRGEHRGLGHRLSA